MKLIKFRVTEFRSIMDSGWIECDNVTSLVGINEAGKSNVILALWKLHPVNDGKIDPLHDMPATKYSSWRQELDQHIFISAEFLLEEVQRRKVQSLTGCQYEDTELALVKRRYDEKYIISFPSYTGKIKLKPETIIGFIDMYADRLNNIELITKIDIANKGIILSDLADLKGAITDREFFEQADIELFEKARSFDYGLSSKSMLIECLVSFRSELEKILEKFVVVNPRDNKEARQYILNELPNFVYYSNYGNLDAQIYLPHAIKWLNGEEVKGIKNDDKVRTLRVLFEFVKLDPEEVLELGVGPITQKLDSYNRIVEVIPTDEEIQMATDKKAERAVLLNSASSDLTEKFRDWWNQGAYIFRFQADGEFFKIWVSDEKRREEIELERRSTGLQWFLSFFLVFLVESQNNHKNAILLLDEAGLSLHPLAQKDLISFFENLSKTNQLIYTTHSPFLVDTSNIDQVKVVYSDEEGKTVVSSNLRESDDRLNEKSIYAVHAALGLSVSDILLQGCQVVIVEGPSDQYYLNGIKQLLSSEGKLSLNFELVFVPSGGVKGVPGIVGITSGKDGVLPKVLLDSDGSGKAAKAKLESSLYKGSEDRIIDIGQFSSITNGEIEDLIPYSLLSRQIDKMFRDIDDEIFGDVYVDSDPIVDQIEGFAKKHNIELDNGWKVDLARSVKQEILRKKNIDFDESYLEIWSKLFEAIKD